MQVGDLVKYVTRNEKEVTALVLEVDVDYARCLFTIATRTVEGWLAYSSLELVNASR